MIPEMFCSQTHLFMTKKCNKWENVVSGERQVESSEMNHTFLKLLKDLKWNFGERSSRLSPPSQCLCHCHFPTLLEILQIYCCTTPPPLLTFPHHQLWSSDWNSAERFSFPPPGFTPPPPEHRLLGIWSLLCAWVYILQRRLRLNRV